VPSLLNTNAQLMCIHGGRVMMHPTQTTVQAGGGFPLCLPDLMSMPIVGCPQAGPGIVPCTMVMATEGVLQPSSKVMIGGRPAYVALQPGVPGGLTNGNPPGMIMCVNPGQLTVSA
jgi:hypothetical protein